MILDGSRAAAQAARVAGRLMGARRVTRPTPVTRPAGRLMGARRVTRPTPVTRPVDVLLRADLALFHALADRSSPVLDVILPRLSRAADHSKLWIASGAVLAATGGRFGRRAALRGLLALSLSSALVNLPGKLGTRRPRPPVDRVPFARRLRRMPRSWSFPSGHAASAAAFAVGAAQERPVLALPLAVVATAVGVSRVYTGAHYPSDVVVGALVGAGIAVSTRRIWPVAPEEPAQARPAFRSVQLAPDAEDGLVFVVNNGAGVGLLRDPAQEVREAFPRAEIVDADPEEFTSALLDAAGRAHTLGIAGGDGSVSAGAAVAHAARLPVVVVPAGTLNHLARDLGIASPQDAAASLTSRNLAAMDVASIAGTIFVNTASMGAYPALVDARQRLEETIGKWPAMVVGLVKVLRNSRPLRVEIDGRPRRIWMLFAGNCRYHPSGFAPGWRGRLDDGQLDLRIVDAEQPLARTRLITAVLTGRLGRSRVYEEYEARRIQVRSLDGPLRLTVDGEAFDGPDDFVIEKLTEPLAVFVPPAS